MLLCTRPRFIPALDPPFWLLPFAAIPCARLWPPLPIRKKRKKRKKEKKERKETYALGRGLREVAGYYAPANHPCLPHSLARSFPVTAIHEVKSVIDPTTAQHCPCARASNGAAAATAAA